MRDMAICDPFYCLFDLRRVSLRTDDVKGIFKDSRLRKTAIIKYGRQKLEGR
jgi:hypothetical protein